MNLSRVISAIAGLGLLLTSTSAFALSRTPWTMHEGLEVSSSNPHGLIAFTCNPTRHGDACEYSVATIPGAYDAGWGPAPDGDIIGMAHYSRVCYAPVTCWDYGDFTYFQTFVDIPSDTEVTEFTITFSGMDDGSRVSIFNSAYPGGLVIPGSYVYLGGSGTTNLAPYVVSGEVNRVVITQVDDCCRENNLRVARVVLNGEIVVPDDLCPDDPNKTEPGVCGCGVADTDSDADGALDCEEACPADPSKTEPGVCGCGVADVDSDGDGALDCQDECASDPDKIDAGVCGCGVADTDSDADGYADCVDACPLDPYNDGDGDGVCGDVDNCDVYNPDQADSDADGAGDACDVCPFDAEDDADGDGVCGDVDLCVETELPESVPTVRLGTNRWADVDGDGVFDTTAPKGQGPGRAYTIEDTAGCSCTQIVAATGVGYGHLKNGCSISVMDCWTACVADADPVACFMECKGM
ncbi:MAG: DUF5011 domain-containing protein [Deltaproteobacteria bacterium]|nr:MAG: DUF5011 domain-containing protein [Deltaproteobacteria bacterium]